VINKQLKTIMIDCVCCGTFITYTLHCLDKQEWIFVAIFGFITIISGIDVFYRAKKFSNEIH
jgi:hypothetical protein